MVLEGGRRGEGGGCVRMAGREEEGSRSGLCYCSIRIETVLQDRFLSISDEFKRVW